MNQKGNQKKKKGKMGKKNRLSGGAKSEQEESRLAELSVDEFMQGDLWEAGSDSDAEAPKAQGKKKKQKGNATNNKGKPARRTATDAANHKAALGKLKDIDPEFYDFLKVNDKNLLEFDISDDDSDPELSKQDDDEDAVHKPPESLEVASDESDYEADDEVASHRPKNAVTIALVREWQNLLATDKSVATIAEVTHAFQAALEQVEGSEETGKFRVEGGATFNAVVRLCLLDLLPAIRRVMKVGEGTITAPAKNKKWTKLKPHLRPYLVALVRLIHAVATPAARRTLLKHALDLIPFYDAHPRAAKALLKECLQLWGASEDESVRVVSFMAVLRLVRTRPSAFHAPAVKRMYTSYVQNSRFTSPSSWPLLLFCCQSLCEVLSLDVQLAYQHAFVYIRQLAIHLRNALTLKAKDSVQAVLNWQFVHCLRLWAHLLGMQPQLKPLVYPLTQVILGTLKLAPTSKHYPLRLQCVSILTKLSRETGVFIPVVPMVLQVLQTYKFNSKHTKVSMKPMDFSCMLKASNTQMAENGFKDALVDGLYGAMLDYFHSQSHRIGFPELALPALVQIKTFLKMCKVTPYTTKMKQLADKIRATSQEVEKRRRAAGLTISDQVAVDAWEAQSKVKGTPLGDLHTQWKREKAKQAVRSGLKTDMDDYGLPTLTKKRKAPTGKEDKFEGLFPSDESDDEEIGFMPVKKAKQDSEIQEDVPVKEEESSDEEEENDDDGVEDIVEDFNMSD